MSGLVSVVFVCTGSELRSSRKADCDPLFFVQKALILLNSIADQARRFAVQGFSFGPGEGSSAIRCVYCWRNQAAKICNFSHTPIYIQDLTPSDYHVFHHKLAFGLRRFFQ